MKASAAAVPGDTRDAPEPEGVREFGLFGGARCTRDLWCQNHETRRSDEINVSNGLRLQSPHQGPTEAAFSAAC